MIRYYEGTKQLDSGEFTDFISYQDVEEDATKIDLSKLELEKTGYKLDERAAENGIIKAEGKKFYADVFVQEK